MIAPDDCGYGVFFVQFLTCGWISVYGLLILEHP
jgi:hypothetical protein